MQDLDDLALLREYAANHSEAAFEELVSRRVGFVYSSALRQARDPHLAEEITQAVFIILAQKAGRISDKTILTGWLFKTTRFAALAQMRAEMKRSLRTATIEKEFQMQNESQSAATDEIWNQMSPLLDEALATLGETDRQAVLLRFFENKSLAEVGNYLGAGEDTARKRVTRALEKLRKFFTKRGVSSTTAILAGAISANSVQAAPMALAKSVTAVAIAKGAAASVSTLTLIKGALKIMAWTKMKTVIVFGVCALVVTGTATLTIHEIIKPKFNLNDFWATSYPTISGSPEVVQSMTNGFGHELDSTLSASPVQLCSISGLLNQCMEISGWRYLIDKDVSAGTVKFGSQKEMTGEEWVAAFENALQTGKPEWWDGKTKRMHRENLVLIRFPEQKTVLVLPKDKSAKYQ
ncbi:MAG TPA: sigma-70 family RNA polymerase sigma factor [Verrucomicrobiae bacterium]|jgi:RNA polymerase sigma factor (sigma-70 family)